MRTDEAMGHRWSPSEKGEASCTDLQFVFATAPLLAVDGEDAVGRGLMSIPSECRIIITGCYHAFGVVM